MLIVSSTAAAGREEHRGGRDRRTSQQYPLLMAADGIEAIAELCKTWRQPEIPAGATFIDTGVASVTDKPVPGIESIDVKTGPEKCWG